MSQPTSLAAAFAPARPACPSCNGTVNRVPRQLIDHLLSSLMPVRRYSCRAVACHWEGTLRDECFDLTPGDSTKRYNRRFDTF
ncbi:MAG: hypothetical protein V4792_09370 [Pseudomonadota bacterium]